MNRIIGGDFGSVKFHKKDRVLSLKAVNSSKISGVSRDPNNFYMVDGGFLLHKGRWDTNKSIDFIIKQYVDYTTHNYSRNSTIVFDGYPEGINVKSTKAAERRAGVAGGRIKV